MFFFSGQNRDSVAEVHQSRRVIEPTNVFEHPNRGSCISYGTLGTHPSSRFDRRRVYLHCIFFLKSALPPGFHICSLSCTTTLLLFFVFGLEFPTHNPTQHDTTAHNPPEV